MAASAGQAERQDQQATHEEVADVLEDLLQRTEFAVLHDQLQSRVSGNETAIAALGENVTSLSAELQERIVSVDALVRADMLQMMESERKREMAAEVAAIVEDMIQQALMTSLQQDVQMLASQLQMSNEMGLVQANALRAQLEAVLAIRAQLEEEAECADVLEDILQRTELAVLADRVEALTTHTAAEQLTLHAAIEHTQQQLRYDMEAALLAQREQDNEAECADVLEDILQRTELGVLADRVTAVTTQTTFDLADQHSTLLAQIEHAQQQLRSDMEATLLAQREQDNEAEVAMYSRTFCSALNSRCR